MIIAAIRYLRRIWVRGEKKRADYTAPRRPFSMFFDREIRSEWYTHASRGEIGYTPNKPKKIVAFYQSFLICLLLRGSSQCGPSVPLLSMTTAGMGLGYYYHHHLLGDSRRWLPLVWVPYWTETAGQPLKAWPTGNFAYAFPISYSERFNQVFRTQRDSTALPSKKNGRDEKKEEEMGRYWGGGE